MASRAKVTKARRKRKATKIGQTRKKEIRNKGTTPKFSIHPK